MLCICNIVILYHDDLEIRAYLRIVIDNLLETEYQVNDILCNNVSRSCLCAENACDRCGRLLACLDLKILVDDIESVQLLTLVFVESLYLDIEDGIRAYLKSLCSLQICAKLLLAVLLYPEKLGKNLFIIGKFSKLLKLISILLVAVAYE